MSGVDLSTLKSYVSASDFTDDDTLLQGFLAASEDHVETYLRRDMSTDYPTEWPSSVQQAVLLLAAYFYDNRGKLTETSKEGMPEMVRDLLSGYRNLS